MEIRAWVEAGLPRRRLQAGTGGFGSLTLRRQPEMMQHWGWWGTLERGQKAVWLHPSAEMG